MSDLFDAASQIGPVRPPTEDERRRAARHVIAKSLDAVDEAELLAMIGLEDAR